MITSFKLGDKNINVNLPKQTHILRMKGAKSIDNPADSIRESLGNPIGTDSFSSIVRNKLKDEPDGDAVIVISDNTRPFSCKGEEGILMPIIRELLNAGVNAEKITVLCTNGTHGPLSDKVFRTMIDPEVYELEIKGCGAEDYFYRLVG